MGFETSGWGAPAGAGAPQSEVSNPKPSTPGPKPSRSPWGEGFRVEGSGFSEGFGTRVVGGSLGFAGEPCAALLSNAAPYKT